MKLFFISIILIFALSSESSTKVPTYFFKELSQSEIEFILLEIPEHSEIMIAAFDLFTKSLIQCEKTGLDHCFNQTLLDRLQKKKLKIWIDISEQWGDGDEKNIYSNWNRIELFLIYLSQKGIEGINFDEWLYWGQDTDSQTQKSGLTSKNFNSLKSKLLTLGLETKLIVTEVKIDLIQKWIESGAIPDAIALAWYTVPEKTAQTQLKSCEKLAKKHSISCFFWVDPSTYSKIKTTLKKAEKVFLWNLCWKELLPDTVRKELKKNLGSDTTCSLPIPDKTRWVPWSIVSPLLN